MISEFTSFSVFFIWVKANKNEKLFDDLNKALLCLTAQSLGAAKPPFQYDNPVFRTRFHWPRSSTQLEIRIFNSGW